MDVTDKEKVIERYLQGHKRLQKAISSLTQEQITKVKLKNWTPKDVVAHISGWNWLFLEDIESVLNNQKPWWIDADIDEINRKFVEERKNWPLEKVLQDWEDSFQAAMKRVGELTSEEWNYKISENWEDSTPITVASLFDYEYEGDVHEGGHAKKIEERFTKR
jgi:hypothetical protein